jgi:hypothetical protein
VSRANEAIEETKNKNKERKKIGKFNTNKIQDFKNTFIFKNQNSTASLPVKWEVCEKSTLLRLCLAKGLVGI